MSRHAALLWGLVVANLVAVVMNVCFGSVQIPLGELLDSHWHYIVCHSRVPSAITALLTGASLGTCGLLLQSYFRNPLAGPSILGITNGAHLMVALVTLGSTTVGLSPTIATMSLHVVAAFIGAFAVLSLLLLLGRYVRSQVTLLILGILLSYLTSAAITLLSYQATQQGLQQLMLWGMGDFGSVGLQGLPWFVAFSLLGITASFLLVKPMNGWMLGELYAQNLGINLRATRLLLLGVTGLLSAVTTAWCGPIAFVGLSMPHAARLLFLTDDHRVLLPASALLGGLCCSVCLRLSTCPDGGTLLPINALTPFFGVPIIIYVLTKTDKNQ